MCCVRISASVSPILPVFTSYIGRLAWLVMHKKRLLILDSNGLHEARRSASLLRKVFYVLLGS